MGERRAEAAGVVRAGVGGQVDSGDERFGKVRLCLAKRGRVSRDGQRGPRAPGRRAVTHGLERVRVSKHRRRGVDDVRRRGDVVEGGGETGGVDARVVGLRVGKKRRRLWIMAARPRADGRGRASPAA